MSTGTKRMWLGTAFMAILVVLLFALLISKFNEVHQKNVKEKGEWKLPKHLKTPARTGSSLRHKVLHLASSVSDNTVAPLDRTTFVQNVPEKKDSVVQKKVVPIQTKRQKQIEKPVVAIVPMSTLPKEILAGSGPSVDNFPPSNEEMENHHSSRIETDAGEAGKHNTGVKHSEHLSDTEFITGMKVAGSTVVPKVFFQTELTNHMILLTALGIQKSNLVHPQIGYGFHAGDHLLIPRIGGVFSPDGYRGVSLGFTEQYHHGHNMLFVINAEYTHSLKEAHESFAFLQVEGFHKIIGPLWLGGGLELLYEHEQSKFSEMADLELLVGAGARIYPGKHWFLYAQSEYDLATLLEHGTHLPHHWVMGNFGVTILMPHRKKT